MGESVYGATPINHSVRNISSHSIQDGVHVLETFAGIGLGVLRATLTADNSVKVYTYIDGDRLNKRIARYMLHQLHRQHFGLILPSTLQSFDCMYMPKDISLIRPANRTILVAHYRRADIYGGRWECQSVS